MATLGPKYLISGQALGPSGQHHSVEVYLRCIMQWLYLEDGSIMLVIVEAPTVWDRGLPQKLLL